MTPKHRRNTRFKDSSVSSADRNTFRNVTPPTCFLLRQPQKSNKIGHFFKQRNVTVPPTAERRLRLLRGRNVTPLFLRGDAVTGRSHFDRQNPERSNT
jgi:hypothetical protein